MFFTTAVMVILLIVALSTATYAWFSTNSTVTVTDTQVTAAQSTSAAIGIGWTIAEAEKGTSITFTNEFNENNALEPMMPKNQPYAGHIDAKTKYILSSVDPEKNENGINKSTPFIEYDYKGVDIQNPTKVEAVRIIDIEDSDGSWDFIFDADIKISDAMETSKYQVLETAPLIPYNKIYYRRQGFEAGFIIVHESVEFLPTEIVPFIVGRSETEYDFYTIETVVTTENTTTFDEINSDSENIDSAPYQVDDADDSGEYRLYKIPSNLLPKYEVLGYDVITTGLGGGSIGEVAVSEDGSYLLTTLGSHEIDCGFINYLNEASNAFVTIDITQITDFVDSKTDGKYIYKIEEQAEISGTTTFEEFTNTLDSTKIDNPERYYPFNTGYIDSNKEFDSSKIFDKKPTIMHKQGDSSANTFIVRNNNTLSGKPADLTISVQIDKPELRVAIFAGDTPDALKYIATFASTSEAPTGYGNIIAGANYEKYEQFNTANTSNAIDLKKNLGQQKSLYVSVVVWYNGEAIDASKAGMKSLFAILINGEPQQ
jgi:hypothetical protein